MIGLFSWEGLFLYCYFDHYAEQDDCDNNGDCATNNGGQGAGVQAGDGQCSDGEDDHCNVEDSAVLLGELVHFLEVRDVHGVFLTRCFRCFSLYE